MQKFVLNLSNKENNNKDILYTLPIYHFHSCSAESLHRQEDPKFKELIEKINKEREYKLASVGIVMDNKVI